MAIPKHLDNHLLKRLQLLRYTETQKSFEVNSVYVKHSSL